MGLPVCLFQERFLNTVEQNKNGIETTATENSGTRQDKKGLKNTKTLCKQGKNYFGLKIETEE